MANDLVLPAFLQALIGKQTSKDVAKFLPAAGVQSLPAHISIADNRFTLVEDDGEARQLQTTYMDAIIVAVADRPSRMYYKEAYVKSENYSPPTCFSDNGVGASSKAAEPQSASCKICPQAVWGASQSKMTGKPIPACSEGQKLAVLFEDRLYMLRLPPMSVKSWESYVRYLEKMLRDRDITLVPSNVITRIDFASQGVLKFEPHNLVTDEINAQIEALDKGEIETLLGMDDKPWEGTMTVQPPLQAVEQQVKNEQIGRNFLKGQTVEEFNEAAKKRTRGPNKPKDPPAAALNGGENAFSPKPPPNPVASFLDRAMGRHGS